jgi:5-methylcytosine-specific restriction protein B
MPDASLLKEDVGGVDLARMLEAINQRIEVLYDRDHTIGHAYLMGVSSIEELRNVFRHRVLPLLQEYFYENWSKIRSVLNDTAAGDFVVQHKTVQLSSDDIDGDESDQRPVYSVNRVVFPIEAFQRIYGK